MKTRTLIGLAAVLLLPTGLFTGCESTDGGSTAVQGSVYYGVGWYDPWYYGSGYYSPDVIVVPPHERPPPKPEVPPPHAEHPIAKPPEVARPTPRPMPSIPSTPRPMPRMGGRR